MRNDRVGVRIDLHKIAVRFAGHIDHPAIVARAVFQLLADLDGGRDAVCRRVDHRDGARITFDDKHMTCDLVERHRVRIQISGNLTGDLQCLQVESNGFTIPAVIGETLSSCHRDRDTMRATGDAADFTHDYTRLCIDHGHTVAVSYVDALGVGVENNIIPSVWRT